jgi:CysZ protein
MSVFSNFMNPIARFFQGINFFFSGLRMLLRYPSLFGLALTPIILTVVVLLGLAWGAVSWLDAGLQQSTLVNGDGRLLLQALAFLLILLVAYLIYLPLTRVFLAPFSEKLSHKTTEISGIKLLAERELSFFRSIWEGVKLVVLQLVVVVLILGLTLLLPPVGVPVGSFLTICFCGLDFVDVPLSVRGLSLRRKLNWLWQSRALLLGFAVAAYVALHVPLLNLLALPVGVIGATMLVNQVESALSAEENG